MGASSQQANPPICLAVSKPIRADGMRLSALLPPEKAKNWPYPLKTLLKDGAVARAFLEKLIRGLPFAQYAIIDRYAISMFVALYR